MYKYGRLYEMNGGIFFYMPYLDQERSWKWCSIDILEAANELSSEGWELVCAASKTMADQEYIMRKVSE